ncbi:MAG: AarF/UbiB family protein [Candidatus Ozemobacteraceae bacterium]
MIEIILAMPLEERRDTVAAFFPEFSSADEAGRATLLRDLLAPIDLEPHRSKIASDLITAIRLDDLLPDLYADFRPIVRDGVAFLLERLSTPRLKELMIEQFLFAPETPSGMRLQRLARRLPTLHKLGQIIARNKAIAPDFRIWLQGLESSRPETPVSYLKERITTLLGERANTITLHAEPLAEASVGVVIGFTTGDGVTGVMKLIKPGVREALDEELLLLDQLARHFDERRSSYPHKDFRYHEVFSEIRESLRSEVDLTHEQRNLELAREFYRDDLNIVIPQVFSPLSHPELTAMSMIHGTQFPSSNTENSEKSDKANPGMQAVFSEKTESHPSLTCNSEAAQRTARLLFRSLVGRSLFSDAEETLYHGDPHAGNLLFLRENADHSPNVALLDWSQAGKLRRAQRQGILHLALGLMTRDRSRCISGLVELMSEPLASHPRRDELMKKLDNAIEYPDPSRSLLERTLDLVDGLALGGFAFPNDLLWFRKSVFTLMGVLRGLDAQFDADVELRRRLETLVLSEMPQRLVTGFFPLADRPGRYRSLVSNLDLCGMLHFALLTGFMEGCRKQVDVAHSSFEKFTNFLTPCLSDERSLEVPVKVETREL